VSVESDFRYQTFWPRFWAGMIDGLIFEPLFWLDLWVFKGVTVPALLVAWFVVGSFSMLAYTIVLHGLFGQTLGKKLTGVRVFDVSGRKLSMRQAVLRDSVVLAIVLFSVAVDLPTVASGINPYDPTTSGSDLGVLRQIPLWASFVWFLVEIVTMFRNPQRRAVHDLIAGSVVMRVAGPTGQGVEVHGAA
jgi:uncharacterized RDD family membrane protein YckC